MVSIDQHDQHQRCCTITAQSTRDAEILAENFQLFLIIIML